MRLAMNRRRRGHGQAGPSAEDWIAGVGLVLLVAAILVMVTGLGG